MMHSLCRPVCVVLMLSLMLCSSPALADRDRSLVPHTADYRIKISLLEGRLTTTLEKTADGYRAESLIRATGLSQVFANGEIRESSEFALSSEGLRPRHFLSSDSLSREPETVDFTFDWDFGTVTGHWNGEPFENQFDGILHDRVSLQYGLMLNLFNEVQQEQYFLQDAEKLKSLSIRNIGNETLAVPFGQFEATGIQHQADGSSRQTTLWVVEELGYLPVIIEQRRKGKLQVRAVLLDYRPDPTH